MSIALGIIQIFVLLFAITIHEASHGWVAYKLGDPTAYLQGRVTLNPIAHIDPLGTIIFPILLVVMRTGFVFGWAKPVPVNPYNLKNPRRDNLWISAAGPLSNILVAFISIILLKLIFPINLSIIRGLSIILYYSVLLNIILAVFNLIPIPPLDGSGVLMGLLPEKAAEQYDRIRPFGFIILLLLIASGIFSVIVDPIFRIIEKIIY